MRARRPFCATAAMLALAGCATIENGTDDDVGIVTDPPGARVNASTGTICYSPCSVSAPRKLAAAVTITKSGYVTQVVALPSMPTAGLEAASRNEPTTDYLGRVVDVQDGSHFEHAPAALVVKLVPVK